MLQKQTGLAARSSKTCSLPEAAPNIGSCQAQIQTTSVLPRNRKEAKFSYLRLFLLSHEVSRTSSQIELLLSGSFVALRYPVSLQPPDSM